MKKLLIFVMAAVCLFAVMAGCTAEPESTETTVPETTVPETTVPEETEVPTEPIPEIKIEGNDLETINELLSIKYKDALNKIKNTVCTKEDATYYVVTEIINGDDVSFDETEKPMPADAMDMANPEDVKKYGYERTYYLDGKNGEQIPTTGYYFTICQDGFIFDSALEEDAFQYRFVDDEYTFAYYKDIYNDDIGLYGSAGQRVVVEAQFFYNEGLVYEIVHNSDGEFLKETWYKCHPGINYSDINRMYVFSTKAFDGYTKQIEYVSDDSFIVKHFVENDPVHQTSREYTWDGKGNDAENIVSFTETIDGVTVTGTQEDIQSGNIIFHMPNLHDF